MAKLLVKLRGEEISRITLESGNEYIAGRASDAHIQLANERGISRHHLKLYERDGVWIVESLSKFVMIFSGGQSMEIVEMPNPTIFSVAPYEFYFEPDGAKSVESDEVVEEPSKNLPAFYNSPEGRNQPVSEDTQGPRVNNEATVAGQSHLVPYIRISFPNTADDEVLKLEGHLWTAGRDPSCEIFIDSPHVSRKHFELARTNEGFFLTDLGSSNGTKLNGLRTPPHEPTRLDSGDELRVMNIVMLFEIRDTHFANRLENLPVPAFDPMFSAPPMQWETPDMDEATQIRSKLEEIPSDWKKLRPHHLKQVDWKKNKVRVALAVLIPLVLIMAALPSKPKTPPLDPSAKGQSVVFENLTLEQKAVVKDSFNLARNLYVQGKYELCLTELAKVHEWIPQFENSKELQSFCEQGKELVHRQRDLERKDREKAVIEQQITGFVESCKARLTVNSTVDETRQCLAEAMELDPEHALIMEMIHTAQMHEDERKFLREQKAETDKKAAKGVAHYRRAKALYEKGQLAKALTAYDNFLESSYPRIEGQKAIARREVASIKKELKVKVGTLVGKCRALGGNQKYKEAYLACDKALQEDPSQSEAKTYRDQMLSELKREMKSIYEDSVLEESLGNVDSAKEKWRKIIKEDLDFDEYTIKSKSKLQKYGINN